MTILDYCRFKKLNQDLKLSSVMPYIISYIFVPADLKVSRSLFCKSELLTCLVPLSCVSFVTL